MESSKIIVGDYRYDMNDILGEGGYCSVYRGIQISTGIQVALKHIPTEKVKQTELESIIKVQCSSYVVRILEIITTSDITYMIMELCDIDLDQYIKSYGKLNDANLDTVGKCLAQGYLILHENEIVHRDIKPHNILLKLKSDYCTTDQPIIEVAKYADFGLSRSSCKNDMQNLAGTLFYMAPEVGANIVDARKYNGCADMWSLGVVLYECICGTLPLTEQQLCKLFLRAMEGNYFGYVPPSLPDNSSDKFKFVISKLLALDPMSRLNPTEFHACIIHENLSSFLRCAQDGPCSVKNVGTDNFRRTPSELFSRILSSVTK